MALDTVPLWMENAGPVHHAEQYRRLFERLVGYDFATSPGTGAGGVARPGDLAVTERGAGANMSVDVAAGGALVKGNEPGEIPGAWWSFNDAVTNLPLSAAHGSQGRFDLIGLQIRDSEYGGVLDDDARLVVVEGTPSGTPAEPSLALMPNFLTLARVTVGAAVGSITNSDILDRRRMLAMLGGTIVCTSSTRPTLNVFEGMVIYESDTNRQCVYDGTGWLILSEPWQAISPVLAQGGTVATAGAGTFAQQRRSNGLLEFEFGLVVSGSGSAATTIQITMPTASSRTTGVVGPGYISDTSANRVFRGTARLVTAATIDILWDRTFGLEALGLDSADPDSLTNPAQMALAAGDSVHVRGVYPISEANSRAA